MGDPETIGGSLTLLGVVASYRRDLETAESLWREALAVFTESGNDRDARQILGFLGWLAIARGDYASARSAIEKSLALSRDAGDRAGIVLNIGNLAHVLVREGRFEEAVGSLREGVLLAHDARGVNGVAESLVELAGAAAGLGMSGDAAVMLGGAEALYQRTESAVEWTTREWQEEILARLRHELDAERLSDLWERGRKMTLDELVAYSVDFIESAR
jgi:tetratricopeptide (TPR) repeat protein